MATAAQWDQWVTDAIRELPAMRSIQLDAGLQAGEMARVEQELGVQLPPELRMLLSAALPVGDRWPSWRNDPVAAAQNARRWVRRAFEFDIAQNSYWPRAWGVRPDEPDAAISMAIPHIEALPPLVPIYGHRYMATTIADFGNAVLSVWQAVDTIIYGNDLADYLHREFGTSRPPWSASESPDLTPWSELFDLDCVGLDDS